MCNGNTEGESILKPSNAPTWIAASAAMTKGVCAPIIVNLAKAGVYVPTAVLWDKVGSLFRRNGEKRGIRENGEGAIGPACLVQDIMWKLRDGRWPGILRWVKT